MAEDAEAMKTLILDSQRISRIGEIAGSVSSRQGSKHKQSLPLSAYTALVSLSLSNTGLSDLSGFPASLSASLKRLYMADNLIRDGLEHISHLDSLVELDLSNNRIESLESLKPLKQLRRLERLHLLKCPVSNERDYRYPRGFNLRSRGNIFALIPSLIALDDEDRQGNQLFSDDDEDDEDEEDEYESEGDEDNENENEEDDDDDADDAREVEDDDADDDDVDDDEVDDLPVHFSRQKSAATENASGEDDDEDEDDELDDDDDDDDQGNTGVRGGKTGAKGKGKARPFGVPNTITATEDDEDEEDRSIEPSAVDFESLLDPHDGPDFLEDDTTEGNRKRRLPSEFDEVLNT